jgi:hypothetical protein
MVYRSVTAKVIETKEESDIPNVGEKGLRAKSNRSKAGKQNVQMTQHAQMLMH